jgi:Fe-S-cluster containining protein
MGINNRIPEIIGNYKKLCAYCDSVWERVRAAYPNEIACRKGCGICCELQSVNRLEAYAIRSYVVNDNSRSQTAETPGNACPFLDRDRACLIYAARPIICRTHGLILRSSEFPMSRQAASCPYNFPSIHPNDFPPELTVDVDAVTKNLTALNLAFCMESGIDVKGKPESRVLLRDFPKNL